MKDWLSLIARILVSSYLVASSIGLIIGYNGVKFYLTINKMKTPELVIIPAIVLTSLSSIFLLSGYKTKIAAGIFLLYLIAINSISPPDLKNPLAILSFCKNISMLGGIVYLMFLEPGRFSIDYFIKKRNRQKANE